VSIEDDADSPAAALPSASYGFDDELDGVPEILATHVHEFAPAGASAEEEEIDTHSTHSSSGFR
jgi:hypothetical protein